MDMKEHWRQRLIELRDALRLKNSQVSRDIDVAESTVHRWFLDQSNPAHKALGPKNQQRLRDAYQLPAGWFDMPQGSALPAPRPEPAESPSAQVNDIAFCTIEPDQPRTVREPMAADAWVRPDMAWPFQKVSQDRLQRLLAAMDPQGARSAMLDLDEALDLAVTQLERRIGSDRRQLRA
jgi:hypothetical protein